MRTAAGVCLLLVSLAVGGCATSIKQAEPTVASNGGPRPAPQPRPSAASHASIPSAPIAATPLSRRTPREGTPSGGAPARDFVSDANIGDVYRGIRSRRDARIETGVHDFARDLEDRIYGRTKLRFSAAYTMVYQHATEGSGPRDALGADFDLMAAWVPVGRKGHNQGGLEAKLEGRYKIGTEIAPAGLSTTFDSLWPTVSGFGTQPFALTQLYWHQYLLGDRLRLLFGKFSASSTFFGNRINSSSLFFFNFAFSDNPAVFFPGNGLGLHAIYDILKRWTFRVGIQNANGIKTEMDPSTLKEGEFWYAAQVEFLPHIQGLGHGTWRLGAWYVDPRAQAGEEAGQGFVLSIDQELARQLIGFLRYEVQDTGLVTREVDVQSLTSTQQTLRLGLGVEGPIRALPHDYLGIGLAWGRPTDTRADDAYVGEIFYRAQVTDSSQLSFGLQGIESSTVYDQVVVFNARYRFEF